MRSRPAWNSLNHVATLPSARGGVHSGPELRSRTTGREIERVECENPVQRHFDAGRRLGMLGALTIVTEGGETIGGYVPYRELVDMLGQG